MYGIFTDIYSFAQWHHGSVENGYNWKVTILLEIHLFLTEPWLWEEVYHKFRWKPSQIHMGIDQNQGSWEGYNRRSIANQSRPQRWQSRRDFVLSNVMCTENKSTIFIYIEIYTSHKLVHPADPCLAKPWRNGQETWAGNGPVTTFGGSSIAAQSRINRGFLDHMETMSTERLTCWLFNV